MRPWRFYVYELLRGGQCVYIGKGCNNRLKVSAAERIVDEGREIARFKREKDAYAFEKKMIAERRPELNIMPGGNGSKAERDYTNNGAKPKWQKEMEAIGTRAYSARLLLSIARQRPELITAPIARLEEIAYAPR